MPAGMYGADPDQLSTLGGKLIAQNEPIAGIQSLVLTTLAGTTWQGPARDKFETEWNDQFNPALNALKDAFTAAGNECTQRANSLRDVMGVGRLTARAEAPACGRTEASELVDRQSRIDQRWRLRQEPSPPKPPAEESAHLHPAPTLHRVTALEFTVEPFVEGNPGPHVRAAVAAVESLGASVEFGPFGSTCQAPAAAMPDLVAALVKAALANGATHVSLHVSDGST